MRPHIQDLWDGIKLTGFKGCLRAFGFSLEEMTEAIEEENEEARKIKTWEKEWHKSLPAKEERENMFGLTDEQKLSIKEKSILGQYELALKNMLLIGKNKQLVDDLKMRYNILIGKYKQSVTDEMIKIAHEKSIQSILEKAGIPIKRDFAICPFHQEKSPSLHITNNVFHCFGCGAEGDAIEFVIKFYSFSFKESVKYLNL